MDMIGIAGAGVMGADVALCCAAAGHQVVLYDISSDALASAKQSLAGRLRLYRMLQPEWQPGSAADISARIYGTTDICALADTALIIENVPEDWQIKQALYQELAKVCRPETYVGINTSCLSVTRLAALMPDPSRVIGMHFMNPVPVTAAVEVMQGFYTSEATIRYCREWLHQLGKKFILVQDMPGFVANRLSHLFMNEAAFLVQDQVAEPAAIDSIFKLGYGHRMGPLETADLIGLDTVVQSLRVLYDAFQDPKFRCCPLLQKMVDAGLYGRKSGRGFYHYQEGST
jgi:3-hydroxybutyryl-CoA dehydrogenase